MCMVPYSYAISPDGAATMRWSLAHARVMFVRAEKFSLFACCVAWRPMVGLPNAGIYAKTSSDAGSVPCFTALSVHGPLCAYAGAADARSTNETEARRMILLL